MRGRVFDIYELWEPLMNFIAASYIVAGLEFSSDDWQLILDNEAAEQDNGYDCGIFVCMNAYTIMRKEPFYSSHTFPDSVAVRKWIVFCLKSEPQLPIILKDGRGKGKVPVNERLRRKDLLEAISIPPVKIEHRSTWQLIKDEINTGMQIWDRCAAANCPGGHDG